MLSANQKITLRQLQILLILDAFGTGVIVLPRRAAEYAAQDGWLIVAGLTLLALLSAFLITTAARIFPSESLIAYTGRLWGKPVAYLVCAGLWLKIVLCFSLELRLFMEIIRITLLRNTPSVVVGGLMLFLGAYAATKGIETRARIGEILILAVMLPLLILFALALFDIDFSNLAPALTAPPERLLSGTMRLGYAFTGLESCLLIFPFLNKPKEGRRAITQAVFLTGVLFILVTIVTIAKFGPEDLLRQPWPVLRMMDLLNIPGSLIERQDALVLSFWIISVFAAINAALFFSAVLSKDLIRHGRPAYHIYAAALVMLGLASLPISTAQVYRYLDCLYLYAGVFYLFIFPILLLAAAYFRGFLSSSPKRPARTGVVKKITTEDVL